MKKKLTRKKKISPKMVSFIILDASRMDDFLREKEKKRSWRFYDYDYHYIQKFSMRQGADDHR